jgi:ubiquinone/menaquinone biosynthesis C-methylase UbiE
MSSRLPFQLRRKDELERLDESGHDPALLRGSLDDLRRVNRWLGGTRLTVRGLERVAAGLRPGDQISVLDVGTGAADIAEAILGWARARGLQPRVVATDISAEILAIAKRGRAEGLEFALADARRLPFAEGSFDVATCSLLLHHLDADGAVAVLREMRRVSRRGVVVNDLVRTWHGYAGAWALSRLCTSNPLTRHDAPVSVRRAYTRRELAELAARAGLGAVEVMPWLGYRVAMAARVS